MKYKIGDRVRIVGDCVWGEESEYIGKTGMISYLNDDCEFPYMVKLDGSEDTVDCCDEELVLLDGETSQVERIVAARIGHIEFRRVGGRVEVWVDHKLTQVLTMSEFDSVVHIVKES